MVLDEVTSIKAIDNHTHIAMSLPNVEYDFQDNVTKIIEYLVEKPKDRGVEEPLRTKEYTELIKTIHDLYGYNQTTITHFTKQELATKILKSRSQGYENAYTNALDKAGIETALVNTYHLQPNLDRKRFKWVPWVDQFLYPIKESNVQVYQMQHNIERWLEMAYERNDGRPESFDEYVSLVRKELARYSEEGAVAVKIWSAFFRSLYFDEIKESDAKQVYDDYLVGRQIDESEYKRLQDYIAHLIFSSCMELEIPVQIHTGFGEGSKFFTLQGSSPLNLENIACNNRFDDLNLILIHGGYPFCREAGSLAMMNDNVYLDFSYIGRLVSIPMLARILGDWIGCKLEDRLLFGTDALKRPWATDDLHCVYIARMTRKAVEHCLSGLLENKILDEDESISVARRVLRENAVDLYRLGDS
ncbi:MAG: amidohydrolase family protein [Candidatus Thorarchaeota archaeon]|jgi:predicted TIM-barrel fold metal-dependent hydrolase